MTSSFPPPKQIIKDLAWRRCQCGKKDRVSATPSAREVRHAPDLHSTGSEIRGLNPSLSLFQRGELALNNGRPPTFSTQGFLLLELLLCGPGVRGPVPRDSASQGSRARRKSATTGGPEQRKTLTMILLILLILILLIFDTKNAIVTNNNDTRNLGRPGCPASASASSPPGSGRPASRPPWPRRASARRHRRTARREGGPRRVG